MELTNTEKKYLLERTQKQILAQIYDQTISAQIAKRIGNDKNMDALQKSLEILEKTNMEYAAEITAVDKRIEQETAEAKG